MALGIADDAWPSALAVVPDLLARCGTLVDLLDHAIPEWGDRPHRRFIAQFVDGVQADLVGVPASARSGRPIGSVALYDPDGHLGNLVEPRVFRPTPADVREWSFLAWMALLDLDKYVRRGSAWEALVRLNEARAHTWKLWAVAESIGYPLFGLTVLLDSNPSLPPGMDATVAGLDLDDLANTARALASQLTIASRAAAVTADGDNAPAIAAYAKRRLAELRTRSPA
jgi:hypothetical protein